MTRDRGERPRPGARTKGVETCHSPAAYCRTVTSTAGFLLIDVEGTGTRDQFGSGPARAWRNAPGPKEVVAGGWARRGGPAFFAFSFFAFSSAQVGIANPRVSGQGVRTPNMARGPVARTFTDDQGGDDEFPVGWVWSAP